jgi:hypothetical protein
MVQGLKFPSQNPNPRGEEGGKERTEPVCSCVRGKRKLAAQEEGVRGFFNPNNSHQKDYITPRLK